MLNFQILFCQFKNSSEVCITENRKEMNLIMCHECRMMWKFPQRHDIA